MKNILIVAPFVSLPGEPYFSRFLHLAHMWSKEFRVTLVTSSFCHALKLHRHRDDLQFRDLPFELVLLDEPGYRTNVSLSRVVSHHQLAVNLRKWLEGQSRLRPFDLVYSAYPLIATNLILARFKARIGFRLIIDVVDVWPEAISSAIPLLGRFKWFLWPLSRKADRAYAAADGLIAVSSTYLKRALQKCPNTPGLAVYLGSDRALSDAIPAAPLRKDVFRLVYMGTLSHSYDVATVVQAVGILRQRHHGLELHILGDGPHADKIRTRAGEGVVFHGFVLFEQMVALAKSCDLAVNPIVKSGAQSVTYKISDYFSLGLPIISSQLNPEVVELIRRSGGDHYEAGNISSFCDAVDRFIEHADREEVQKRTRQIGSELFDRAVTYQHITAFVRNLLD